MPVRKIPTEIHPIAPASFKYKCECRRHSGGSADPGLAMNNEIKAVVLHGKIKDFVRLCLAEIAAPKESGNLSVDIMELHPKHVHAQGVLNKDGFFASRRCD